MSKPAPNRLLNETSPYLLQHAYNPVDWYPWSDEALERAQREDKPIFLSIGYAACHWCHVMERESFENDEIAAFMNEHFVNIKVDREERPDLDEIYMAAVQMMTGSGGWPMSVFLTPDRKPFFGGTYFPPDDRFGRPGFARLLRALHQAYATRRDEVESGAKQAAEQIASMSAIPPGNGFLTVSVLEKGADSLMRSFDPVYGGFGGAPKFPHTMGLQILLRHHVRTGDATSLRLTAATLDKMAEGGIYDHLGGGFHRYATDERWLVPHFEKMLYDQALLVIAYLEGFQLTGSPLYSRVVRETLDYVLRDLISPDGAFYSSEDADSEGEEGKFYVWTREEVKEVLGEEGGDLFCRAYDVDEVGNFEGRSILHPVRSARDLALQLSKPEDEVERILAQGRQSLLEARSRRVRPGRDEKVLASWNGLMIGALSRAGHILDELSYVDAAKRAADFVLGHMQIEGRLHRAYRAGQVRHPGYLDDYANLAAGLVDLYETTFEDRRLREAERLVDQMTAEFADTKDGGFFLSSERHQGLIARLKTAQDGSVPSGNSQAAWVCLRLGRLLGREDLERQGESTLRAFQTYLERAPGAFHHMLVALDLYLGPRNEIVLVGPRAAGGTQALLAAVRRRFLPRAVLTWFDGPPRGSLPLHQGKTQVGGHPAAYVCVNFICDRPVTEPEDLEALLSPEPRPRRGAGEAPAPPEPSAFSG